MNHSGKEIIFFQGGLGNQMFQYAFYLAKKHNKSNVEYDTGLFRLFSQHNGYELERIFNVKTKFSFINLILLFFLKRITCVSRIFNKYVYMLNDCMPSTFVSSYLSSHKGFVLYYGYWQTEQYFIDIREDILNAFSFNEHLLNRQSKEYLGKIKRTNSISIHIRRGDYLQEKNNVLYGNICTLEFYQKAIEKIIETVHNPTFYIFSNEIGWIKNNMDISNAIYVCCNYGKDSWQDMYLMSQCQHNIIANSSFSWWGAWLNKNPRKIVISPPKFMNVGCSADIIPESWIKIEND